MLKKVKKLLVLIKRTLSFIRDSRIYVKLRFLIIDCYFYYLFYDETIDFITALHP